MAKIRTRARAVDMLGRQQIATVQNAIAELFKNAYDAYAKRVQVDYLRGNGVDENGTLLVRDNGIGMTKDDFENKWLVLGTESKVNANREPGYIPEGMSPRKITGEKGIGRLAIALLGRQVVVFTRAERKDGLHDLVVCWIHWGLFEIPGVNLDDIEIPVKTFKGGELPELNAILALRDSFTSGIKNSTAYKMAPERCDKIIKEIESLNPDLKALDAFFEKSSDGKGFSLTGDGCGTTFFVGSVNRVIPTELDAENSAQDYSFRRLLLGFVDPVFSRVITDFNVSFKVWNPGSFVGTEYLNDEVFFTRHELDDLTDHYFTGDVDEYGQFHGRCRIFDVEYPDLKIVWRNVKGKKTECGPFKVVFAALQGKKSESMIARRSLEDYNAIYAKMAQIGGMYVFRDGIKILPYGNNDFDWLDIEKRRNLGAGYYYFSYRRMLGAVLLSNHDNGALVEKAGREGLQKNVPYQQLRSIMANILEQITAEYFRSEGRNTSVFERQKEEFRKESEALERKLKQSRFKTERFAKELTAFFDVFDNDKVKDAADQVLRALDDKMQRAASISDPDEAAIRLMAVEQESNDELVQLKSKYIIKRPPGVGLPKRLQQDWQAYQEEFARMEENVFIPCANAIVARIGEVAKQAKIYIDQRKRLERQLTRLADERKKQLKASITDATKTAGTAQAAVLDITKRANAALEGVILEIQTEMNSTPLQDLTDAEVEKLRVKWETKLNQIEEEHQKGVDAAKEMLSSLANTLNESGGEEAAAVASAMEKRVLDLEAQADQDFEMIQLGTAVSIINHEFMVAVAQIRTGLRDLHEISLRAKAVRPVYDQIRNNFEHLDGHLKLFTPLQRRIQRQRVAISGTDLRQYVEDVFSGRFLRHVVELVVTDNFKHMSVNCFPSTLYPVMINLVDNAFYWLSSVQGDRKMLFDFVDGSIVIANNGPKIERRDADRIFERGFSRKPGGRGLGLYISAKALEPEKMVLRLVEPPEGYHAAFRIELPMKKGE